MSEFNFEADLPESTALADSPVFIEAFDRQLWLNGQQFRYAEHASTSAEEQCRYLNTLALEQGIIEQPALLHGSVMYLPKQGTTHASGAVALISERHISRDSQPLPPSYGIFKGFTYAFKPGTHNTNKNEPVICSKVELQEPVFTAVYDGKPCAYSPIESSHVEFIEDSRQGVRAHVLGQLADCQIVEFKEAADKISQTLFEGRHHLNSISETGTIFRAAVVESSPVAVDRQYIYELAIKNLSKLILAGLGSHNLRKYTIDSITVIEPCSEGYTVTGPTTKTGVLVDVELLPERINSQSVNNSVGLLCTPAFVVQTARDQIRIPLETVTRLGSP